MIRLVIFLWVMMLAALLGAGCFASMHRACYQECMGRHQRCVTDAKTTNALEWCDHYQRQCRARCSR